MGFKGEKDTIKGCCFVRVEKVTKKREGGHFVCLAFRANKGELEIRKKKEAKEVSLIEISTFGYELFGYFIFECILF